MRSSRDPHLVFKELTLNTQKLDGDPVKEKIAGLTLLFFACLFAIISGYKLKLYWDKIKPKKKMYEMQEDEIEIEEIDEPYDHVVATSSKKKKVKVSSMVEISEDAIE